MDDRKGARLACALLHPVTVFVTKCWVTNHLTLPWCPEMRAGPPLAEDCPEVPCPNGHEFEQTPGGSEGQRSLACCRP